MNPIETEYNNRRYRSRTEARWAVFLTNLGIPFDYEKEGYDLNGTWYLPDFWIPTWDMFIEVKGDDPTWNEEKKCVLLARQSGKNVMLCTGAPDIENHKMFIMTGEGSLGTGHVQFRQCRRCPEIFLMWIDENGQDCHGESIGHPGVAAYMRENPKHECLDRWPSICGNLQAAFRAAMKARFEFGENG